MLTANDFLTGNKQNLFGNFNMDATGNNEIGAWLRRLAQGSGEQASQGIAFQNSLEPQRQGAITGLVNNSNPANMIANAQSQGQGYVRQAGAQGQQNAARLGQMGFGAGAQGGAVQNALNQGVQTKNQALFQANSPEAQNQALQSMLQAIAQSPGAGLNQLLQMFGPIEQRNSANAAAHANNGLGGTGQLLGAGLSMWNPVAGAGFNALAQGAGNSIGSNVGNIFNNQPDYSWLNGVLY